MELTKNPDTISISQVMDELVVHIDRSLRRPMNLILALIEEIRLMKFPPGAEAVLAMKLRELLRVGLSPAEVADLERILNILREGLATLTVP